ncbi:GATA transcription factor 4-like [Punica granatum]|uniref:GATA transcription factor n=2 Tax=Punica granatum TaxID=22663 RepID=A0A218X194_PUNGR|nr:GATA transcription factor 4-like [Punica granatum]OWM78112.1 hypothetical protein CDL15_Pgr014931 [Punica granatum]PKI79308.1 hypothetical protein CRG98_000322 [Punica granatum]
MEAPEHFVSGGYYGYGTSGLIPQKPTEQAQFMVDDLLNFSNEDMAMTGDGFSDNAVANSAESSGFTAVDSCNSSVSGGENYFSSSFGSRNFGDTSFSADLCVPNDDVAELEWLSNFVEDSFSNAHNLQLHFPTLNLGSGPNPPTSDSSQSDPNSQSGSAHSFPEAPLPSKSRSRRSRAAPCDWTTRLLYLSEAKPSKSKPSPDPAAPDDTHQEQVGRRCLHCAAEKTPQWRTGPMGPKTLCNACGVRYKSGRLVPEYRPAASPTFVSTKHSNSHRKVLELRRQKDMQRVAQAQQQLLCHRSIMGVSNGGDDCLNNHCSGPSYGHLI